MMTVTQIVEQLNSLRHQIARSATDLRESELRAADATEEHLRAYATAYRDARGTLKDREQQAILQTLATRRARERALIEVNYLKQRARDLEAQQTNLQSQARLIVGGAA